MAFVKGHLKLKMQLYLSGSALRRSKPTQRASTGLKPCLRWAKTDSANLYRPPTHFTGVKTDSTSICRLTTRFATDEAMIEQQGGLIPALRRSKPTLRASTGLKSALRRAKAGSASLYRPPTRFATERINSLNPYRAFYTLCCGRNRLYETLRA